MYIFEFILKKYYLDSFWKNITWYKYSWNISFVFHVVTFLRACSPYGPMKSAIVIPKKESNIEKKILLVTMSVYTHCHQGLFPALAFPCRMRASDRYNMNKYLILNNSGIQWFLIPIVSHSHKWKRKTLHCRNTVLNWNVKGKCPKYYQAVVFSVHHNESWNILKVLPILGILRVCHLRGCVRKNFAFRKRSIFYILPYKSVPFWPQNCLTIGSISAQN